MPMKLFLTLTVLFVSISARANEVAPMQDQQMVLFNQTTIQELQTTIADSKLTLDQKIAAVKTALTQDAKANDGYCATGVKTWGQAGGRPKPEKVAEACEYAFADDDFLKDIASGEFMANAPAGSDMRTTLSRIYSGYILLLAMGPF